MILIPISSPTPHGYEDFSRDSFDERMISSRGMRGPSPPGRRYAPYWDEFYYHGGSWVPAAAYGGAFATIAPPILPGYNYNYNAMDGAACWLLYWSPHNQQLQHVPLLHVWMPSPW